MLCWKSAGNNRPHRPWGELLRGRSIPALPGDRDKEGARAAAPPVLAMAPSPVKAAAVGVQELEPRDAFTHQFSSPNHSSLNGNAPKRAGHPPRATQRLLGGICLLRLESLLQRLILLKKTPIFLQSCRSTLQQGETELCL